MTRPPGSLDAAVGADEGVIAGGSSELANVGFDGIIGGLGCGHKDCLNQTMIAFVTISDSRAVKKNLRARGCGAQERSEHLNQSLLVIQIAQAETPDVGNEVVSVYDVLHSSIVNHSHISSRDWRGREICVYNLSQQMEVWIDRTTI